MGQGSITIDRPADFQRKRPAKMRLDSTEVEARKQSQRLRRETRRADRRAIQTARRTAAAFDVETFA